MTDFVQPTDAPIAVVSKREPVGSPFTYGREMEENVEEFLSICHRATCSDIMLMEGFWVRLDDESRMVIPRGNSYWMLAEYINFALWVEGSSVTVGEVEEDPTTSVQPHLPSITTPEPEPDPVPTPTAEMEPKPTAD
ncbi:hypothetical protein DPX16_15098 [Anabarilius grahami]|uniref:Uncharacterized protein n=1 Tax=Anabarilius grahami TaxID=495550 RepID=A0A3N0YYB2_ANAGA|nr:hypothetical protein DPX16_15098 [Anabarilius grahami]